MSWRIMTITKHENIEIKQKGNFCLFFLHFWKRGKIIPGPEFILFIFQMPSMMCSSLWCWGYWRGTYWPQHQCLTYIKLFYISFSMTAAWCVVVVWSWGCWRGTLMASTSVSDWRKFVLCIFQYGSSMMSRSYVMWCLMLWSWSGETQMLPISSTIYIKAKWRIMSSV